MPLKIELLRGRRFSREWWFGLLGYGFVAFVALLVLWTCLVYWQAVASPLVQEGGGRALLGALAQTVLATACIFLLTAYLRCVITHPGGIPDEFHRFWEEMDSQPTSDCESAAEEAPATNLLLARSNERKRNGNPRFCRKCRKFKPDRSHHDSVTNRCVLKMDHFCPWVNNTVGFFNQGFFVQFLLWATVAAGWVAATMLPAFLNALSNKSAKKSLDELRMQIVLDWLLCAVFTVALLAFSAFHMNLVLTNRTTIEIYEKRHYLHQYNVGRKRNIEQVCGERRLFWLLPFGSGPRGDGVVYPTNATHGEELADADV